MHTPFTHTLNLGWFRVSNLNRQKRQIKPWLRCRGSTQTPPERLKCVKSVRYSLQLTVKHIKLKFHRHAPCLSQRRSLTLENKTMNKHAVADKANMQSYIIFFCALPLLCVVEYSVGGNLYSLSLIQFLGLWSHYTALCFRGINKQNCL